MECAAWVELGVGGSVEVWMGSGGSGKWVEEEEEDVEELVFSRREWSDEMRVRGMQGLEERIPFCNAR